MARGLGAGTIHFGDDDHSWQGPGPGRKKVWHPTQDMMDRIVALIRDGTPMSEICAMPDMPSDYVVRQWRKASHSFDVEVRKAKRDRPTRSDPARMAFDWTVGMEIINAVRGGTTLSQVCKREDMPCLATVRRWRNHFPAFHSSMLSAQRDLDAELRRKRRASTFLVP